MKKRILTLVAVATAACCLSACTDGSAADEYAKLNEMLNANYSQVVLTVTDAFDEDTSLKSEYVIKYSESSVTVNYTVEKFAESSLDNPSTDLKLTLIGEAVINDGVVVPVSGDDINLTPDIARTGFTFKGEYFENAELAGIYFTADVKNASAFLGSQLTCTGMKVEATFLEVFYDINVTYTSASGSRVEFNYVFTI